MNLRTAAFFSALHLGCAVDSRQMMRQEVTSTGAVFVAPPDDAPPPELAEGGCTWGSWCGRRPTGANQYCSSYCAGCSNCNVVASTPSPTPVATPATPATPAPPLYCADCTTQGNGIADGGNCGFCGSQGTLSCSASWGCNVGNCNVACIIPTPTLAPTLAPTSSPTALVTPAPTVGAPTVCSCPSKTSGHQTYVQYCSPDNSNQCQAYELQHNVATCYQGVEITNGAECEAAASTIWAGKTGSQAYGGEYSHCAFPKGCAVYISGSYQKAFLGTCATATGKHQNYPMICKKSR